MPGRPIPSLDDLKLIGWNVSLVHTVVLVGFGLWPLACAVGFARTAALQPEAGPLRTFARLVAVGGATGLLAVVARHDPGRVFEWLLD